MFTKTEDCLEIGNIRRHSKGLKTLPAVQFNCKTEQGEGQVMILALTFGSPVVRLTLEALYLTAIGRMDETSLRNLCLGKLPSISNDDWALRETLHELRKLRINDYQGEISLNVSTETLGDIFKMLNLEGSLSFSLVLEIDNANLLESFEQINIEYLRDLLGEDTEKILSEVSNNNEYLDYLSRYFYPEDCFINRGYLQLDYINSLTGGAYEGYETLKKAYLVDDHFRENPDFFNKTHCDCGGELVVRKTGGEYTLMSCINPFCYEKIAFSLADFARAMGVDGLGEITMLSIVRTIALRNLENNGDISVTYRMVLKEENSSYFGDANAAKWFQFLDSIKNYTGTLKELVVNMSLPYISSDASRILTAEVLRNNNLTPPDLYKQCKKNGKHDLKFMLNLWLNLEDIRYVALTLAESINLNTVSEYLIYITKGVRLKLDDGRIISYTKKQFEELVNKVLREEGLDTVRLKVNGSLTHKCNVLIADQGRDTGSCRKAETWGIPIMTSREFIQHLGGGDSE